MLEGWGHSQECPCFLYPATLHEVDTDERNSGVRLSISVSVEYVRTRAQISDRWEARVSTVGLLVGGAVVVFLMLWLVGRIIGLL